MKKRITALAVSLMLLMGVMGAALGATSWGPANYYNVTTVWTGSGSSPAVIDCPTGQRVLIQYQGFGYGPLDSTGRLIMSLDGVNGGTGYTSKTWNNTELDGTNRRWVSTFNVVYLLRWNVSQAWSGGDGRLWASCTTQAAGTYPTAG